MPKVQIQFHAEPEEAVLLGLAWARTHGLIAVLEQFFPVYTCAAAPDAGPESVPTTELGNVARVAMCRRKPDLSATSAQQFASRNSDCLFLQIGGRSDDGLRESALGGESIDRETISIWRAILRGAESEMHRGATVRAPASGSSTSAPRHLHTVGAHELSKQGVAMLAAAGWNEFLFDDIRSGEG